MEYKIGEVFECNGEWYQCVEANNDDCIEYDLAKLYPYKEIAQNIGLCSAKLRNDSKSVTFKKLEKVGKPYMLEDRKFQMYRVFRPPYIYHKTDCSWQSFVFPYYYCVSLEIK